jgi:hypothetical protein
VSPSKPAAIFHEDVNGTATVKNLHLTIPGNASSSVTIQWSTDDTTHATEVRFGDAPDKLVNIAHGFSFGYGVSGRREHEVHLCGLYPNRTYYYDAGGSKNRSKVYKVTTAPDGIADISLIVAGDTRTTPATWGAMQTNMLAQGATAMLFTGDAVYSGTSQSDWDNLFAAAPDLFAQMPTIWAHGNHENLAEPYFAQLALPDHGGTTNIEEWFATTYGPLRVVTLNDTVASGSTLTGSEKGFLSNTLAAVDRTKTPFVAAMHHTPMYTASDGHGSNTPLRGAWGPLFDQYHVNTVFNGHVHSYESTAPLKGGTASADGSIVSDSQGTRYFAFGGGGAPLYGFTGKPAWIVGQEAAHGFALLKVSAANMIWTAYRQDGSTIETLTINP